MINKQFALLRLVYFCLIYFYINNNFKELSKKKKILVAPLIWDIFRQLKLKV